MCLVSTFVFMFLLTGTTDNASPAQSRSSSKKSNASNGTPSSHSTTHAIQAQADSPNKETTVSNNRKKKGRLFHSFMSFFLQIQILMVLGQISQKESSLIVTADQS